MVKKETQPPTQKRILVLCVDRDADLDVKAGIKTPVVGREANLSAAVSLALKDSEEPDANAMFEAVSLLDRLQKDKKPDEVFDVATISGSEIGGVNADRKIVEELNSLLEGFNASEVILVSDGYSDEAILPLVESRVPVSSVRRIVIKHSESIEETAAVFTKYVRLLVDNPRYSRIALGLPGLLVFILGVLWAANFIIPGAINYYFIAIILVLGGFLLIKGFGVDRTTKDFYKWAREYDPPALPIQISNYTIIAGILCVFVSIYLGLGNVSVNAAPFPKDPSGWIVAVPKLTSYFIRGIMDLLVAGLCIVLLGRSIRLYLERDSRLFRNVALIVSVAWSRWILDGTANIIYNPYNLTPAYGLNDPNFATFIFSIIVGILIGIASILCIMIVQKSSKGFFSKNVENQPPMPSSEQTPQDAKADEEKQ
jgi:putative membrane protein